ncbi:uncharacterized protein LOC112691766 [Sipha flava]|nr:uncharacterized protein LOC112691766 [Sipha flava]
MIPSKSVIEKNYTQRFTTNQSIEKIKIFDSMMIHSRALELKNHDLKSETENWRNLCETCNTIENSHIPVCVWSQDDNNIYLNLNIIKIDNFRVNCTMQSIMFNAQYKDVSYTFCAMLYGFIRPKITHSISVEGVCIKARKLYRGSNKIILFKVKFSIEIYQPKILFILIIYFNKIY